MCGTVSSSAAPYEASGKTPHLESELCWIPHICCQGQQSQVPLGLNPGFSRILTNCVFLGEGYMCVCVFCLLSLLFFICRVGTIESLHRVFYED